MRYLDALLLASKLKRSIHLDLDHTVEIVGSVRRKEDVINDIDLLIITPRYHDNIFASIHFNNRNILVKKIISQGDRRCSLLVSIHKSVSRRVDLFYATDTEYPFAMMHHIGPKSYNLRVRRLAKIKGYKLNQYGLFYTGRNTRVRHKFNNECDIQKFLDISCRSYSFR
jgi:DNA polymerase (family 10)